MRSSNLSTGGSFVVEVRRCTNPPPITLPCPEYRTRSFHRRGYRPSTSRLASPPAFAARTAPGAPPKRTNASLFDHQIHFLSTRHHRESLPRPETSPPTTQRGATVSARGVRVLRAKMAGDTAAGARLPRVPEDGENPEIEANPDVEVPLLAKPPKPKDVFHGRRGKRKFGRNRKTGAV